MQHLQMIVPLQACSCNDAVIASADLIDWDQGSISCGETPPLMHAHSLQNEMHLIHPPQPILELLLS